MTPNIPHAIFTTLSYVVSYRERDHIAPGSSSGLLLGSRNRDGHIHPATLSARQNETRDVFGTDSNGPH